MDGATAGSVPHKVGAGDSPSFSPDGSRLLFIDKKTILNERIIQAMP
jgi:hypothetical protein